MSKRLINLEHKIVSWQVASQMRGIWKLKSQKVAFTNGCFDILHLGHISYLAQAASRADKLIVGINSDASIKQLQKGPDRPINDQHARSMVLAALSFVDAVVVFEQNTPFELISQLNPDILLKGADYNAAQNDPQAKDLIVGSEHVKSYGGIIETIPFVDGYSTTAIFSKRK